jgi:hypothetical protein
MGKVLKWIAFVLGGLIGLALIAVLALGLLGGSRLNRVYHVEPEAIPIPTDPASLERGRHLALSICADCHGENLGGDLFLDASGMATFYAPNITTGAGGMGGQPVDDLVLAIRHGIDQDGTPLLVMPAEVFVNFSEEGSAPGREQHARPSNLLDGARAALGGAIWKTLPGGIRQPQPALPRHAAGGGEP